MKNNKNKNNRWKSVFLIFGFIALISYVFFSRIGPKISSSDEKYLSTDNLPVEIPIEELDEKLVEELAEEFDEELVVEYAEDWMALDLPDKINPVDNVTNPEILRLRDEFGNDDIIGYLRIEGTTIDYPVVQTTDNEFYADYDINKKFDIAGWPFMDYENALHRNDKNTVIYAHNMKADYETGERFHSLRYYTNEDYFKNHPIVTFNTLNGDFEWEVFTFFATIIEEAEKFEEFAEEFVPYIEIYTENNDEWRGVLAKMKEMSMYDTGIEVTGEDRVILLSTCMSGEPEWRYVLGCRLVQ